jgi:hypothetical protein
MDLGNVCKNYINGSLPPRTKPCRVVALILDCRHNPLLDLDLLFGMTHAVYPGCVTFHVSTQIQEADAYALPPKECGPRLVF